MRVEDLAFERHRQRVKEGRRVCFMWPGAGMLQCAWPTCGCPSDVEEARQEAKIRGVIIATDWDTQGESHAG